MRSPSSTITTLIVAALATFGGSNAFQPAPPVLQRGLVLPPPQQHHPPHSTNTSHRASPKNHVPHSKRRRQMPKRPQALVDSVPREFKSRSMQSFQEALERGEAEHLMPVFNAKQKIARGELRQEDIP